MAGMIRAMLYAACFPADVHVTIEVDNTTALKLTVGEYRSKKLRPWQGSSICCMRSFAGSEGLCASMCERTE
eukprot:1095374-Pyramimonas_sp.AAC.1